MNRSSFFVKAVISFAIIGLFMTGSGSALAACGQLDHQSTLRRGSIGKSVELLQSVANTHFNEDLQIDGNFGGGTRAAMIRVQRALGIGADGIIGRKTYFALNEFCNNKQKPESENNSFSHQAKKFNNPDEFKKFIEKILRIRIFMLDQAKVFNLPQCH